MQPAVKPQAAQPGVPGDSAASLSPKAGVDATEPLAPDELAVQDPPMLASQPGPAPSVFRLPQSGNEFVTAVAHFHRAEIARMAGWRDRIDRTTNWAITVVAAMLSVSLSTPSSHHGVLLFAMVIVLLLLWIEARRYRFFDVYRARVRLMERNWFAQMFAPVPEIDTGWVRQLGEDLRRPRFLIKHGEAMSRRLRRNYGWLFFILLLAWVLKVSSSQVQQGAVRFDLVQSFEDTIRAAALGPVPGWFVWLGLAGLYGWLGYVAWSVPENGGELAHGDVHV
jgi:uncharacterized membrane protein